MIPPMPMIYLWPLVVLILFKRCSPATALCWAIIGGYLFLPGRVGLDLPVLPAINKKTMPSYAAIVMAALFVGRNYGVLRTKNVQANLDSLKGWLPRNPIGMALFFGMIASVVLTVMTNSDRLVYTLITLPGLRTYDAFAATLTMVVALLPMLLGRKYLSSPQSHKALLLTFCIAGFVYSFLALYEIRMSPRLNFHIYGFTPAGWRQHLRGDGFRPLVFLKHGLWLGIFMSGAVLAAITCIKISDVKKKWRYWAIAVWILGTLMLSKTLGALLITFALAPVMLFLTIRMQLLVAGILAGMVLFYPMLRSADLIPLDRAVLIAEKIEEERAKSLQYRINNENILLAKAKQRPYFGWGSWGRARVYNENGRDISTTDGMWVITVGEEGWIGYLSRFGLLCVPMLLLAWRRKKMDVSYATSGLCIVLTGNLLDLIPNASLTPITWLMAGALWGRLELKEEYLVQNEEPAESDIPLKNRYSRPRPIKAVRGEPKKGGAVPGRPVYGRPKTSHV